MSRQSANIVASFAAKTHNYNREILNVLKLNNELLKSFTQIKSESDKVGKSTRDTAKDFDFSALRIGALIVVMKRLASEMIKLSAASSRAQEIQQKFNVVFRHNRQAMQAWIDDLSDATNRSGTELEAMAAHLQNTFVPLGFAREEAERLSRRMTELTLDLSSFNDLPTARVVDDLRSALLGNIRAVRKYGVSANQLRIQQVALTNGWITEGEEIDAVTKAMAINEIILNDTRDAHGDLERTMNQTANVTRAFHDQVTRSKEIAGDYINFFLTPVKRELLEIIEAYNQAKEAKLEYLKFERGEGEVFSAEKALQHVKDQIAEQKRLIEITEAGVTQWGRSQREVIEEAERQIDNLERQEKKLQAILIYEQVRAMNLEDQEASVETITDEVEDQYDLFRNTTPLLTEYEMRIMEIEDAYAEHLKQLAESRRRWLELRDILRQIEALDMAKPFIALGKFVDGIPTIATGISGLVQALASRDLELFENTIREQEELREEQYEKEKQRLAESIEDKELRDNALLQLEEDFNKESERIAEENQAKKDQMLYDAELKAWKFDLLSAIASGAGAQARAWADYPFPVSAVVSGIAALETGLHIATIRAQKPIKNFQTGTRGFTVPEGFPNDSFNVGLSSGERVVVDTPTQQADSDAGGMQLIQFVMGDRVVGQIMRRALDRRNVILYAKDIH